MHVCGYYVNFVLFINHEFSGEGVVYANFHL